MKLMGGYWEATVLLYFLLALFVGLYIYSRKKIFLTIGLFVNPFGYDFLFYWLMKKTQSFIIADIIFYIISLSFFLLFLHYSNINAKIYIKNSTEFVKIKFDKIINFLKISS